MDYKHIAQEFFGFAKDTIIDVAKQIIPGQDKKKLVEEQLRKFIMNEIVEPINFPGIDAIWDKIIDGILIAVLPVFIQFVYDIIKSEAVEI